MLIYNKIYNDIRNKILTGELQPGENLPTDAELERSYGVSRSPVRQALGQLSSEGLIIRGAGRKSRVAEKVNLYQWVPGTGFRRLFERYWDHMECKTIKADMQIPPIRGVEFLESGQNTKVTHLLRVRYFFGEPIMVTSTYLCPEFPLDLFKRLGDIPGLRETIFQNFGRIYKKVRETLKVSMLPADCAALLDLPANSPILEVNRYVSDDRDMPLLFHLRYTKTDKWNYEVEF